MLYINRKRCLLHNEYFKLRIVTDVSITTLSRSTSRRTIRQRSISVMKIPRFGEAIFIVSSDVKVINYIVFMFRKIFFAKGNIYLLIYRFEPVML